MTGKRFNFVKNENCVEDTLTSICYDVDSYRFDSKLVELLNELYEESEQLRNRINDWRQRTFKAHEYFNILEEVIDEICNDDISNEIWKEYEKRERLIE